MKKISLILSVTIIFTVLLTGCGLAGFGGEEEEEARERLNVADWPTPVLEAPTPTPTPFPKTPLSDSAAGDSSNDAPVAQPTAVAGGQTLNFSGNPLELVEQITTLTGLTPVGVAFITADDTAIQQRPEASAEPLGTLSQSNAAAVLGQDDSGDWLYVLTDSLIQGWLPADSIRMAAGSVAEAPVLPADQAGAVDQQAAAQALAQTETTGAGSSTSIFSELAPVGAAFVTTDGTPIRSRPSDSAGVVKNLDQGEVAGVLGKDSTGNWLYVVTLDLAQGWMPLESLRVVGALEEARVLPPDPVAAILGRSASSSSGAGTPVKPLDVDTLEPVASAQVNNALLNLRQRPGASYKLLITLNEGDTVDVLALNRDKEWALVRTAANELGWGSMDYLDINGSVANAPQLQTLDSENADQIAPIVSLSGSSGGVAATSNITPASAVTTNASASTGTGQPARKNTLAPVATGEITEKTEPRRGPGTTYGQLETLTVDSPVTVRGVNPVRDWAIVESTNRRVGWVPVSAFTIAAGSLDNASEVLSAWVESNEIEVLSGPGIFNDTVGTAAINSLVSVLGLNDGRNWALIETMDGGLGWIPLRFLEVSGTLSDIPPAPELPVAQNAPAEASIPAPSGPPAGLLVLQTASGGDIMLINADGRNLRQLTTGIDPAFSPDGQQIAFTRWQGDNGSLWAINTDGTNERVISPEIRKVKGPDWSPDGSQIIVNFQHGGRLEDQRLCRNAEDNPSIPRNATDIEGAISSDFKFQLCWTIPPDEQWGLRLVDVSNGSFKDLYGGLYAFRPAFDPSRPWRVVSDSGNGLLAVDINRDDYRESLTDNRGDGSPAMSPDGRFIAVSTDVQGGHDIFRMNADGSGRVRLTQTPLWIPVQPDSSSKQWNNVSPVWSPDGSQIAFLTDREGRWEIWVMNADGSNQRPMFPNDVNEQLDITYNFVDEQALDWR